MRLLRLFIREIEAINCSGIRVIGYGPLNGPGAYDYGAGAYKYGPMMIQQIKLKHYESTSTPNLDFAGTLRLLIWDCAKCPLAPWYGVTSDLMGNYSCKCSRVEAFLYEILSVSW